jgi:hypothetical protein
MSANETQEANIIIKIDNVVYVKLFRLLSFECSLNLKNSLENITTRKKNAFVYYSNTKFTGSNEHAFSPETDSCPVG